MARDPAMPQRLEMAQARRIDDWLREHTTICHSACGLLRTLFAALCESPCGYCCGNIGDLSPATYSLCGSTGELLCVVPKFSPMIVGMILFLDLIHWSGTTTSGVICGLGCDGPNATLVNGTDWNATLANGTAWEDTAEWDQLFGATKKECVCWSVMASLSLFLIFGNLLFFGL